MRYDPLSDSLPPEPEAKPKAKAKAKTALKVLPAPKPVALVANELSRNALRVPPATFACLLGNADLKAAKRVQADFAEWCKASSETDWRQAWRSFHSAPAPKATLPQASVSIIKPIGGNSLDAALAALRNL